MARAVPQVFGRYALTELIGEGGMAEVYLASVRVAEGLTKRVVIKKIRKEFADRPEFTRMFVDEAKIALSLNHANIVQVFDFGQVRGAFYLAMELVEGIDLIHLFHLVRSRDEAFPAVIAAYVAHQVAAGLAYAHRKADDYGQPLGIVHRDVSPHNVMVSFEGQVKILDFGIARTKERSIEETAPVLRLPGGGEESIKGKVAYMSPEQAKGRPVDQRSDIYSLGVCLYELLAGDLLFRTRDRNAALEQVRNQPIAPLRTVSPDVAGELAAIVDRCLQREPDSRYQAARELQADLATWLHRADPVVDDEVLSKYVARYQVPHHHPRITGGREFFTRETGDSHSTQLPMAPKGEAQRIVVVHLALEPHVTLPDQPAPDPRRFIGLARDVAFKREAHVVRSGPSDIVLALGAVLTSGDDAERGLRIALALRQEVSETAPGMGVGILVATAPAVVRHVGPATIEVELRPGVEEQIAHVARRFLDGPIVVSADLVERLSRAWRFETAFVSSAGIERTADIEPELQQPARLIGPVSATDQRVHHVPGGRKLLYGRELELKTVRDTFSEAIRSRESRTLLVIGAAGMGKRALVERFVGSLPRTACWILRGVARWSTRNEPLGVFLEILSSFLHIDRNTSRREIAQRLTEHGVTEAEELSAALAVALGIPDGKDVALGPLERRDRLWRLIRRIIRGLSTRRPVLVLVENLHFMDEQSLALFREWIAVRHPLPIFGLVTSRPGPRTDRLRKEPHLPVIELGELDERARKELIVRRFEDPSEAEPLADAVLARTGGHPLFIEEVLASLLHQGTIAWNAQGRFLRVQRPGADIELPPSVEGAIQSRVEDLLPADREVLMGASTLGRAFRTGELVDLLQHGVDKSIHRLLELHLLEADDASPAADLRFATLSLFDVCRSLASPELSQRWHGRAAEIKRQRLEYTPGRDDGPIADHLIAAGRADEAVDYAIQAARHAQEVAGNVEAYTHLSQALKAMHPDDPRLFDLLLDREAILRGWGRRRARSADIRKMLAIAEHHDDLQQRVIASLRLLRLLIEIGRLHRADRLAEGIADGIDQLGSPGPLLAVLGELRSQLALARGQFELAERCAREALAHCGNDLLGQRHRCRIHQSLGQVQLGLGNHPAAQSEYEAALSLAQRIGDRRLEADVLNSLGEVAGRSTRYQLAIDRFKAALAIDRDLGDRHSTGRKLANLGIIYAALGLHSRAERYLRKALELHEALGDPAEFNDVAVHLGEVLAALDDLEGARTLLTDAADVARRRGDVRTRLRANTRLALALVQHGSPSDLADARRLALESVELGRTHGLRTACARAYHALARVSVAEGDVEQAIEHEREAVRRIRAGAAPVDGVRSVHHLGLLLRDHGNPEEGRALLDEAAAAVERRAEELRDPDLQRGYLDQVEVRRILSDGRAA